MWWPSCLDQAGCNDGTGVDRQPAAGNVLQEAKLRALVAGDQVDDAWLIGFVFDALLPSTDGLVAQVTVLVAALNEDGHEADALAIERSDVVWDDV